jgi:hypothetical protein
MDFTRISKAHILFEMRFCTGVPGIFQLSQIHPWFKKIPLERAGCLQCSPWGWGAARLAGIGWLRRRPWPGKWRERTRGSPRVRLRPKKGAGRLRHGGLAVPTGGCRGTAGSGEVAAPWGKWASRRAIVGARGGGGRLSWVMRPARPWVHRGGL